MKRFVAVVAAAMLGLTACAAPVHHRVPQHVKILHTKDGRWAYHDTTSDFWFWYIIINNSSPTVTLPPIPGMPSGIWVKGAAPTPKEIEESELLEAEMEITENGEPVIEASSVEAAEAGEVSSGSVDAGSVSSDSGSSTGGDGGASSDGGGDGGE